MPWENQPGTLLQLHSMVTSNNFLAHAKEEVEKALKSSNRGHTIP
jgi:hypothetical protein